MSRFRLPEVENTQREERPRSAWNPRTSRQTQDEIVRLG